MTLLTNNSNRDTTRTRQTGTQHAANTHKTAKTGIQIPQTIFEYLYLIFEYSVTAIVLI